MTFAIETMRKFHMRDVRDVRDVHKVVIFYSIKVKLKEV